MAFDPAAVTPLSAPPPTNDFVPDRPLFENPLSAAEPAYESTAASTSLGGAIGQLAASNPMARVGRQLELEQAQEEADPVTALRAARRAAGIPESADTSETYAHVATPSPLLSKTEANARYAPPGTELFTADTPDSVARVMGKQKADEIQRDSYLSRWAGQAGLATRVTAGLAAGLLDPLNDAAAFVPGIGEGAALANMGRLGFSTSTSIARLAARGISGATAGAAGMVPLVGLNYGLAQMEGSDYSLRDAMSDLAFGAAVGAAGHAGFGALREAGVLRPDELMHASAALRSDAARSAVAQMMGERPVDTQPVFDANAAEPPSITAYHGSPYSFDAFHTNGTIGTGEGTQSFGHGLYFAENPAVADQYRKLGGDAANSYQVRLHVDPALLLDHDKSFEEQAPQVQEALRSLGVTSGRGDQLMDMVANEMYRRAGSPLSGDVSWAEAASKALHDAGVPGVRYLDAGSRGNDFSVSTELGEEGPPKYGVTGPSGVKRGTFETREEAKALASSLNEKDATRNFVIFDHRDVEITHKNGVPFDPAKAAQVQQAVYRDGYAPGVPQAEFDAARDAIYGVGKDQRAIAPEKTVSGKATETQADKALAEWQARFDAAGVELTPEEKAHMDTIAASLDRAIATAEGFAQAGECLTGAGI